MFSLVEYFLGNIEDVKYRNYKDIKGTVHVRNFGKERRLREPRLRFFELFRGGTVNILIGEYEG